MDGDNKNNKEYICQHVGCNKPFKSRSARMYHQKRCSTGPLQSPRRKAKKVATEAGIKKKCRYCPKTFNHAASLSRHQKKDCEAARLFAGKSPSKKRPRTKKSFHCAECDKCFDRLSKYNAHLMTHQRKMHECPDCFKQFKRIDKFKNHSCSSSELESTLLHAEKDLFIITLLTINWWLDFPKNAYLICSFLNYGQKSLIFKRFENLELTKLMFDLINNRHKLTSFF